MTTRQKAERQFRHRAVVVAARQTAEQLTADLRLMWETAGPAETILLTAWIDQAAKLARDLASLTLGD